MSYLSAREALRVSDAFLVTMYGHDVFKRWAQIKTKLKFNKERDFIIWVLDYIETNCVELENFSEESGDTNARASAERNSNFEWANQRAEAGEGDDCEPDANYAPYDEYEVDGDGYYETNTSQEHEHQFKAPAAAMKILQTSPRQKQCSHCDKMIAVSKLKHHINSVHTKERMHSCPHCDKQFSRKDKCNGHVKAVHSKIKDFLCDQCHKSFTRSDHLKQHIKSVHNESKDCVCPTCGKQFSTQGYVDSHMKNVHDRKADISCELCDFMTTHKVKLKVHRRVVHNIPPKVKRIRKRHSKASSKSKVVGKNQEDDVEDYVHHSSEETVEATAAITNEDEAAESPQCHTYQEETRPIAAHSHYQLPIMTGVHPPAAASYVGGTSVTPMDNITHQIQLENHAAAATAASHILAATAGVLQPKTWWK